MNVVVINDNESKVNLCLIRFKTLMITLLCLCEDFPVSILFVKNALSACLLFSIFKL